MIKTKSSTRANLFWILLTMLGVALFVGLGVWQIQRAEQKRAILSAHQSAGRLPLADLGATTPRYTRVTGRGHYIPRQIYLDNQMLQGRPGVEVFTPLRFDGGRVIMVNRGWRPLPPDRKSLPSAPVPADPVAVSGRIDRPPQVGIRLGEARRLSRDQWPQLVTYLDLKRIADALQLEISPWVLELSPNAPAGFTGRGDAPVNFGPDRHLAYAYTWFTMAAAVAIVYLLVSRRGASSRVEEPDAH